MSIDLKYVMATVKSAGSLTPVWTIWLQGDLGFGLNVICLVAELQKHHSRHSLYEHIRLKSVLVVVCISCVLCIVTEICTGQFHYKILLKFYVLSNLGYRLLNKSARLM